MNTKKNIISREVIENFLTGEDDEKYIVDIEYNYKTNKIYKIIQDPEKGKVIRSDSFVPFLWLGDISHLNFYKKNKAEQRKAIAKHGIIFEKLNTHDNERLENGLTTIVKSIKSYVNLLNFFKEGGVDPWDKKNRDYFMILNPVEQYLIQKRKRFFKGFNDYDDLHKLIFDIETTGLDPETDKIILIGVKDNRGFKKIIPAFGEDGEKTCIEHFLLILNQLKPDIIGGYNSASFDFPFILERARKLKVKTYELTQILSDIPIKEKEGLLKLANEVEPYTQFKLWGFNVIDVSHSVRRAQAINSEIKKWNLKYIVQYLEKEKPNRVYVDGAFISKIYLDNKDYYFNPKTGKYREVGSEGTENLLKRYPGAYIIKNGQEIVEQYLEDDCDETIVADDSFSQASFLLSKLVPTTYEKISTMGTATLWKIIMLAWSYENNLAIPEKDIQRSFTGGLSRLVKVGFAENIIKLDFSSLYPSLELVYDVFPSCDVMNVQKSMLKYFRDVRIKYKMLGIKYEKNDEILSKKYNRKQLPLKIFINAYFGSLSAPLVFPWADMDCGEMTTCLGRQSLRMGLMFFMDRNYVPLVMDTDGINFTTPDDVDNKIYIGKGLNELVEKGKEYKGIEADVAEFNDIFMRNEMGLDIDGIYESTINISRKNYITKQIKKGKEKIKITGNTIKSKKIQSYVSDFLDNSFKLLLDGKGEEFIDYYYEYVEKIINKEIPLAKIANKARVKMRVDEYKKHIKKKTKAGNSMARQAHMELVIKNDHHATLGETIYYVNDSDKKSHGDVQKLSKPKYTGKEAKEYRINNGKEPPKIDLGLKLNCYMIPEKDIEYEPNKLGNYNVPRYLNIFNKRIEPLLVVFKPEIRDRILVKNHLKFEKPAFTPNQMKLCNGFPIKKETQDDINEILMLSDSEVLFWNKVKKDPYFLYVEDSIKHIDQEWVKKNRRILNFEDDSIHEKNDGIVERNGHDYATHTNYEKD